MKKLGFMMILAATLVLAFGANAAAFSYNFGSLGYAEGQLMEGTVYDFATLTSEDGGVIYTNAYGAGLMDNGGATGDLYFNFSTAVSNLSFRAGDGAGDFDAFAVSLYEFGTNNFLGTWDSPVFGGTAEPEWYTLNLAVANVGLAIFDPGNSGSLPGDYNLAGGVILTDFGYDAAAIPEPATMLLVGLGMAGIGIIRRKRS